MDQQDFRPKISAIRLPAKLHFHVKEMKVSGFHCYFRKKTTFFTVT